MGPIRTTATLIKSMIQQVYLDQGGTRTPYEDRLKVVLEPLAADLEAAADVDAAYALALATIEADGQEIVSDEEFAAGE